MSSKGSKTLRKGFIRIIKSRSSQDITQATRESDRYSNITLPVGETRERSSSGLSWDNFGLELNDNNQVYPSAPLSSDNLTIQTSSQAALPEIRINNENVKTSGSSNSQLSILSRAIKYGPAPRKCCIKTNNTKLGMSIKGPNGGFKISEVDDHSLASEAGLLPGDYIIELTGMGPVTKVDRDHFHEKIREMNTKNDDIEFIVADPFTLYRLHVSKEFKEGYLPFDEDVPYECIIDGISSDQKVGMSISHSTEGDIYNYLFML